MLFMYTEKQHYRIYYFSINRNDFYLFITSSLCWCLVGIVSLTDPRQHACIHAVGSNEVTVYYVYRDTSSVNAENNIISYRI